MPRKFPPEDCRSDFLACFIIVISYTSVSVAREFLWPRRTIEQILQNKNQMISSSSPAEADCGSSRVSSSSPAEADYGSSPPMEKKIVPPSVHFRFPDHIPQPEPKEEHEKNTFSCIVIDVLSLPDAQTLETIVNDAYTIGEDGMWNDASSTSSPGAPGGGDEGGLVPTTPPAALTPAAAPPTHFRTAADDLTERRVLRTSAAEILDRAKRWEVLVVYASGSEEAELPGVGPPFGRPVGCVCVDRTLRRAEEGAGDAAPVAGFGMLAVDKKVLGKRLGDYLVRCAELWARGEAEAVVQQQREVGVVLSYRSSQKVGGVLCRGEDPQRGRGSHVVASVVSLWTNFATSV